MFKAAPKLFTQLFTIHGQQSGYTVPCVYALLPYENDTFKLHIKKVYALAFLHLVASFKTLATTFLADDLPLLSYFDSLLAAYDFLHYSHYIGYIMSCDMCLTGPVQYQYAP